jgi:hypothetical protein
LCAIRGRCAIARHGSLEGGSLCSSRLIVLNDRDEAVAAARNGFDIAWLVCAVSQCGADLIDGEVDAAFEVDEGVVAPDVLVDFFAGDNLSGALCQEQEHGKRLRLEPDRVAAFAQLTTGGIECEGAEAN